MAVYKADILDVELNTGNIARSFLCHNIGKDDTKADRFGVRVYRDGEPESLSGCSIQGYMMRPNGTNLAITGSNTGVSGNEAWVDLPQAAYDYEGQFCLALKLIGGGVTGTIRIIDGMINNTFVDDALVPMQSVPTYQEILAVYDQMVAAKNGSVRFDQSQSLTETQKSVARMNIDAARDSDVADLKSAMNDVAQINIYTLSNSVPGKTINASGEETSASNGLYTGIIPVRKGEKYKVSFDYNSGTGWTVRIHGYNLSGEWVEQLTSATCSGDGGKADIDIEVQNNSTIAGIRVSFFRYDLVLNPKIVQYVNDYSDITAIDYVARNRCETINTELNIRTGVDTPSIIYKSDSAYIKDNGVIVQNSSYFYSTAVAVEKGNVIDFYGKGYNQNVAMISDCDLNAENITPRIISIDSTIRHYVYMVEQDGFITISGSKNAEHMLTIYKATSAYALLSKMETKQDYIYASFSMFRTFGVVGDSYASGYIDLTPSAGDTHVDYNLSWGQILARMSGNKCYNFSRGGLSTETWLTDSKGKTALESEVPLNLYIICLGINDYLYATYPLGNLSDIGTDAETFFGYYSKIITAITNHSQDAKIILSKMRSGRTGGQAAFTADQVNEAIGAIAQYYGLPCIAPDDDDLFKSDFYLNKKSQGHPVAVMYSAMAKAYRNLIEEAMLDNLTYFYDYTDADE